MLKQNKKYDSFFIKIVKYYIFAFALFFLILVDYSTCEQHLNYFEKRNVLATALSVSSFFEASYLKGHHRCLLKCLKLMNKHLNYGFKRCNFSLPLSSRIMIADVFPEPFCSSSFKTTFITNGFSNELNTILLALQSKKCSLRSRKLILQNGNFSIHNHLLPFINFFFKRFKNKILCCNLNLGLCRRKCVVALNFIDAFFFVSDLNASTLVKSRPLSRTNISKFTHSSKNFGFLKNSFFNGVSHFVPSPAFSFGFSSNVFFSCLSSVADSSSCSSSDLSKKNYEQKHWRYLMQESVRDDFLGPSLAETNKNLVDIPPDRSDDYFCPYNMRNYHKYNTLSYNSTFKYDGIATVDYEKAKIPKFGLSPPRPLLEKDLLHPSIPYGWRVFAAICMDKDNEYNKKKYNFFDRNAYLRNLNELKFITWARLSTRMMNSTAKMLRLFNIKYHFDDYDDDQEKENEEIMGEMEGNKHNNSNKFFSYNLFDDNKNSDNLNNMYPWHADNIENNEQLQRFLFNRNRTQFLYKTKLQEKERKSKLEHVMYTSDRTQGNFFLFTAPTLHHAFNFVVSNPLSKCDLYKTQYIYEYFDKTKEHFLLGVPLNEEVESQYLVYALDEVTNPLHNISNSNNTSGISNRNSTSGISNRNSYRNLFKGDENIKNESHSNASIVADSVESTRPVASSFLHQNKREILEEKHLRFLCRSTSVIRRGELRSPRRDDEYDLKNAPLHQYLPVTDEQIEFVKKVIPPPKLNKNKPVGEILIIRAKDQDEAEEFVLRDPFTRANLYKKIFVARMKEVDFYGKHSQFYGAATSARGKEYEVTTSISRNYEGESEKKDLWKTEFDIIGAITNDFLNLTEDATELLDQPFYHDYLKQWAYLSLPEGEYLAGNLKYSGQAQTGDVLDPAATTADLINMSEEYSRDFIPGFWMLKNETRVLYNNSNSIIFGSSLDGSFSWKKNVNEATLKEALIMHEFEKQLIRLGLYSRWEGIYDPYTRQGIDGALKRHLSDDEELSIQWAHENFDTNNKLSADDHTPRGMEFLNDDMLRYKENDYKNLMMWPDTVHNIHSNFMKKLKKGELSVADYPFRDLTFMNSTKGKFNKKKKPLYTVAEEPCVFNISLWRET